MNKDTFIELLSKASKSSRDFARTMIIEGLPDTVVFKVRLNCSYDGNPLHADERVYPDDRERFTEGQLEGLQIEYVVELLWRDGRVPEWIDISVIDADDEHTIVEARCCGRFTDNDALLYYDEEGTIAVHDPLIGGPRPSPFHVVGPSLPLSISFDESIEEPRFSLYWDTTLDASQLERLGELADKVERLTLKGHDVGDREVERLKGMRRLLALNLESTSVQGPGLQEAPKTIDFLKIKDSPDVPFDLRNLEALRSLQTLEVERSGIDMQSLSSLKNLPRLRTLSLRGTSITDDDLTYLFGLPKLRHFFIWDTKVTPKGVKRLRRRLPIVCRVHS